MALRLEFPLISCNSLAHLMRRRTDTVLVYLAEDRNSDAIPGSIWLPLSALRDADDFYSRLRILETGDPSRAVICYEQEGLTQAACAWWFLVSRGRSLVYVLEGGLQKWGTNSNHGTDPDSGLLKEAEETIFPTRATESQQEVTTDADMGARLYINPALLLNGNDLAEPKALKYMLSKAGVRLDDASQTIVYGSKAQLLLLVLCSLGKNNLRLGVEFQDMQLYGEDDGSLAPPRRQLSNLSEPEMQSTRSSVRMDAMALSSPGFGTRQRRSRTHDFTATTSCRGCLLQ